MLPDRLYRFSSDDFLTSTVFGWLIDVSKRQIGWERKTEV